jgi:hypothetical protein
VAAPSSFANGDGLCEESIRRRTDRCAWIA